MLCSDNYHGRCLDSLIVLEIEYYCYYQIDSHDVHFLLIRVLSKFFKFILSTLQL